MCKRPPFHGNPLCKEPNMERSNIDKEGNIRHVRVGGGEMCGFEVTCIGN
ncbi:hypothetical protein QJS04_geneDACA022873 [Acorus gramineus]|uniref:Uncharacterized protein n=1 Tax=Acorus gramineus TaxID=55184 RepID=A0AAV9B159_ACOGR|nr:hypothetical protein QJS04_geneDACA022873 [Acorus gramineus]